MWWKNRFLNVARGKLSLGGTPAEALAAKHGTPLFVYGRAEILARYEELVRLFGRFSPVQVRICYAMKANPHPGILRTLERKGAWIDAVSPGEVQAALVAGFPPGRILFTGTSVSYEDFRRTLAVRGLTLTIDALEQLDTVQDIVRRWPRAQRTGLRLCMRWNPGIDGGFHPKVITAGRTTPEGTPIKFGIEDRALPAAFARAASLGFRVVGFHQHLGSGWARQDFPAVRAAVEKMVRMAAALERKGHRLEFLDFGGGFGPRYTEDQKLFPLERYARLIGRAVIAAGLSVNALCVEPGKYLVGEAGVLLMRVEYVKESYGNLFACVNAGTFNSVARPAIYAAAFHPIVNASNIAAGPKRPVTVAGNLCETGDVFGKKIVMPLPKKGDILAVLLAGAYCRSMASRFNLREIPREILL